MNDAVPIPTVLVFGGRGSVSDEHSASAAWARVVENLQPSLADHAKRSWRIVIDAAGEIQPPPGDLQNHLPQERVQDVGPIVIPFLDDGLQPAPWLRDQLLRYLRTYNVWAIVAVGRAALTQRLLDALHPLQVPVFVTLSSVAHLSAQVSDDAEHGNHIVSLYPSNDTQAQVIAAQVRSLVAASRQPVRDIDILKETANDPYVMDLTQALEQNFRLLSLQARDALTAPTRTPIAVCVGYGVVMSKLERLRRRYKHVVMTDGVDAATAERRGARKLYRVRPIVEPDLHAAQAFCAIRFVLRSAYWNVAVSRGTELKAFVARVVEQLEVDNDNYRFARTRNTRASYVCEHVNVSTD